MAQVSLYSSSSSSYNVDGVEGGRRWSVGGGVASDVDLVGASMWSQKSLRSVMVFSLPPTFNSCSMPTIYACTCAHIRLSIHIYRTITVIYTL